MDERELDETLRTGLAVRAEDADTTVPLVARARAEVRRRRRARWSVAAVAASVGVVVGGTTLLALTGNEPVELVPLETTAGPASEEGDWRTEYWADVAVDIPADWGFGGAPDEEGIACYPEAMVGPDGQRIDGGSGRGYVGRPISATDVCALVPKAWEPEAPYVWLGAGIEPGVHEYGNGYVQETVEANGSTVTVGTPDDALRKRILSTVRAEELCPSDSPDRLARHGWTREGRGEFISASVCVYDYLGARAGYRLTYAGELDEAAVERTFAAVGDAPVPQAMCDAEPTEYVVVSATYEDPYGARGLEQSVVFDLSCAGTVALRDERPVREITPGSVAPWARNGIPAVVHGPSTVPWVYDYFIGPQG